MIRRSSTVWLIALIAAVLLAACGGGGTPQAAAKTFSLEATEFAFSPNAFDAKAGEEVTFKIKNAGTLEHNFVVFDPSGAELARTTIAVGATGSVTVKPAAAGSYAIDCDIPGHKEAGMVATLTVSP